VAAIDESVPAPVTSAGFLGALTHGASRTITIDSFPACETGLWA
jgi:hypothetical protein